MTDHEPTRTMPDPLLTKTEAMTYLGVSLRTLNRLISAREIVYVKVGPRGGAIRFDRRDLQEYVHQKRTKPDRRGGAK